MKTKYLHTLALTTFTVFAMHGQYTDVINSNRPGGSASAYSVGKNVVQGEAGFFYEKREHDRLLTESNFIGGDFAVRYGFLFEQLEISWEGTYAREEFTDNSTFPAFTATRSDFLKHTVGAKYLIFDPYKKERKPNLYSWRANNGFHWRDLIPAVSVYAGANINLGDNEFYPDDPSISPKVMLITQSHLGSRWVFVSNLIYDKFTEDDPIFNYILTLTHALKDPRYSVFVEHQGFKSDAYGDGLFRAGGARLFNRDLQVDISAGINIKDTPSRIFGGVGLSYRLDFHKDEFKPVETPDNLSDFDKKTLKKQKKKKKNKNVFENDNLE